MISLNLFDTYYKVEINRTRFDVCTPSRFGGVKTNVSTFVHTHVYMSTVYMARDVVTNTPTLRTMTGLFRSVFHSLIVVRSTVFNQLSKI